MLVVDYNNFVQRSDQAAGRPNPERLDIAIYGLASELGALIAAFKKRLLGESGSEKWNQPNEEIVEELGDVLWYAFSLAQSANQDGQVNIFTNDIANLKKELSGDSKNSELVLRALDTSKRDLFLKRAAALPRTNAMHFEDYQTLAFLTARTDKKVLVEVCLAVLWQLGAELFRHKLPASEKAINRQVADRPINQVLGEIAWHLAALASIYKLKLSTIAGRNVEKVTFRLEPGAPTPLHDHGFPKSQQFPRRFEIAFITVGKGRSRMYMDGRQLGSELTDNAYDEDGYRFHDIMHLANVSKLGWSPVLRSLMARKRKRDPKVDEVEDGARAAIVEEAIVKAIHSEGVRMARLRHPTTKLGELDLFCTRDDVTFRFLKFIHGFVDGLEVARNKYWEWEAAILDGYRVFRALRLEEQGTIEIDLDARSMKFRPEVFIDLHGATSGIGSAVVRSSDYKDLTRRDLRRVAMITTHEVERAPDRDVGAWLARIVAVKRAILETLSIPPTNQNLRLLSTTMLDDKRISVKALGRVRTVVWSKGIINFKTTVASSGDLVTCTALAVSDAKDFARV